MGAATEVGRLVRASAGGDQAAWNELVHRYARHVMKVIEGFRLSEADAKDISQTVWLRLVEHLGTLHQPEALAGWLRTTARNECVRLLRRAQRVLPVDPQSGEVMDQAAPDDLGAEAERAELRQALRDGLAELPTRDQHLLRLYAAATTYKEIRELLAMKPGSVAPTIGRCLGRLRQTRAMRAYLEAPLAAGARAAGEREGGDRLELARVD